MSKFGLVVIGAHTGIWLQNLIKNYEGQKIILVEPVPHNLKELKKNLLGFNSITIDPITVGAKSEIKKLFNIKKESINKLKKHWASGIGSFNKEHILAHKTKRFKVEEKDIEMIEINCLSIEDFIKKYEISYIDTLQIDAEGAEYEILNSLDLNKISINKIFFESKHFDGTFQEGKNLELIKQKLLSNNYNIKQIDSENILAEKITISD